MVAKAEWLGDKHNPRFVVTVLSQERGRRCPLLTRSGDNTGAIPEPCVTEPGQVKRDPSLFIGDGVRPRLAPAA